MAAGGFDLVIYEQCVPEKMPQANTLFIGTTPPLPDWKAEPKYDQPIIIDIDRAHPITQLVEMGNVAIADGTPIRGPSGATTLFDSDGGPLLVLAGRDGFEDVVLGFRNHRSQRSGRPTTENGLDRSTQLSTIRHERDPLPRWQSRGTGARERTAWNRRHAAEHRARRGASGRDSERPDSAGESRGAERVRLHANRRDWHLRRSRRRVSRGEPAVRRQSVRPAQSDLTLTPEIKLGYELVPGSASAEPVRREFWKWLMLIGLAVLLFEWYVYNRRVYF